MKPARRFRRLAVAVAVMSLFAATAGVALGTWTASKSQSVSYTSWGPLQTPTGVSLSNSSCTGGVDTVHVTWSIPAGSGGDITEALISTTGSGGSYSTQGHVLLTDLSWDLTASANTVVWVKVHSYVGFEPGLTSAFSTPVSITTLNC